MNKFGARIKRARALVGAFIVLVILTGAVEAQVGWTEAQRGEKGRDLNAVYFADEKRGWIGGDEGFISHTEDGGRSWSKQSLTTKDAVNDIYFRSKEDGFVLAGNSIFTTSDSGQTWHESRRFYAEDFNRAVPELYSVRFIGKKKGWIVGSVSRNDVVVDSLVLFTNDGGNSWQRKIVPTHGELIHLDFDNDKRGWVVGAGGTILKTEDGGETWTRQRSSISATLYHVDFRGEQGWAVGERSTILRTTDGGQHWLLMSAPVRATLLSVQFVNEDEGWIVGRGGVILRSGDGGQTWIQQETPTKQNLYALFMSKKNGWVVGGDGSVLRYER